MAKMNAALETQTTLHQEALQRAKKAENKSETLQNQLIRLEEDLLSGDVLRDALKLEKQKVIISVCRKGTKPVSEKKTAVNGLVLNASKMGICSTMLVHIHYYKNALVYS